MAHKDDKLKKLLKKSNDKRVFEQKKQEEIQEKMNNTSKKVNNERSESDAKKVKDKVTGAEQDAPPY